MVRNRIIVIEAPARYGAVKSSAAIGCLIKFQPMAAWQYDLFAFLKTRVSNQSELRHSPKVQLDPAQLLGQPNDSSIASPRATNAPCAFGKRELKINGRESLMKKLLTAAAIVGAAAFGMASQASADGHACGSMTMAEMNWASAELMANVDKIILEEGYGCEVELVSGATMTTFASMNEKGQPDVAAELWINAVREPLFKAMDEGRLMSAVKGPITQLGEGWWIPPHTAEKHPEIVNDVNALLSRPDLFPHPEDPSKENFVGCPAEWGYQLSNANLFRAFDMEAKGWLLGIRFRCWP